MSSFKVSGTLHFADETSQVTASFKKREFVLEVPGTYPDFVKFQLTQDKTALLDAFSLGDEVTVHFNLRGKIYEKDGKTSYFTNLDAWKLEAGEGQPQAAPAPQKQAATKPAATAKEAVKANQASKDDYSGQVSDEDDGLPF